MEGDDQDRMGMFLFHKVMSFGRLNLRGFSLQVGIKFKIHLSSSRITGLRIIVPGRSEGRKSTLKVAVEAWTMLLALSKRARGLVSLLIWEDNAFFDFPIE